MSASALAVVIGLYIVVMFAIARFTARRADAKAFFIGARQSKWYAVAFGMIGTSLSGITFISVPGQVGTEQFAYMQIVFGYLAGYIVIAFVLLPLYYKLQLTSIYTYLQQRFGEVTYKTGSAFFLLSRTLGASLRVFLVVSVLHIFVLDAFPWHIPFEVTATFILLLILFYTYKGGVKTIVWTDLVQTTCMVAAVILSVYFILSAIDINLGQLLSIANDKGYTRIYHGDVNSKLYFWKEFLSGAFITIVMTGLDQEMMQKNLSCHNLKEARKNMLSFSVVLVFVNLCFMILGAGLYVYTTSKNIAIPARTDTLFPTIALKYMNPVAGLIFIIGLVSALFPSADGALTALTTSTCYDILGFEKKPWGAGHKQRIRYTVHISFAILLLICVIVFKHLNNAAVIGILFKVAGYTYGPLLGLYAFGLFSNRAFKDKVAPYICIISPILCYFLDVYSKRIFNGYQFGYELLLINGLFVVAGLYAFSRPPKNVTHAI